MKQIDLFEKLGNRPIAGSVKMMMTMTRGTVGGRINRLDIKFGDGSTLKGVKFINEKIIELPDEYADEEIESVSIPYAQD